jgi:hypothetical protein
MMDTANVISFPAGDRGATPKAESSIPAGAVIALSSLAQMDVALLAAGDSQVYLNSLTMNDKVHRIRDMIERGIIVSTDFLPAAVISANTDPVAEVHPFGTVWINELTPEAFQTPGGGVWVSIWV